ncbi:hypothetical protein GCM10020221_36300 [Streptomyces thioluteus]|uniref:Uncharacterized protein n=1 Tax=Streptomyces thioluteus TaxID=66431 RepID=A0ABN3X4D3_STRTU
MLLDLADDAGLRAAAAGWKDRVVTVTGTPDADGPLAGAAALLVRPRRVRRLGRRRRRRPVRGAAPLVRTARGGPAAHSTTIRRDTA